MHSRGEKCIPKGKARQSREDNINTDLKETEREGVDWIHLTQHKDQWQALVDTEMNHEVP
jgi:hypothetical protein